MGVRSYLEELFGNLGKNLGKQEGYNREYTEHLLHGKPLSAEAQRVGEETGMNAAMPMFTVSPHTGLWRGIINSLGKKEVLGNTKFKAALQNMLYSIDPDLAKRMTVESGASLRRGVAGVVYHNIPGQTDNEVLAILRKYKEGQIDNPGIHHQVSLKPIQQLIDEGSLLGERLTTTGHELMGHVKDVESGYLPSKKIAEEVGGSKEEFLSRITQPQRLTPSEIRKITETNAEYMGHLYTRGNSPFTRSIENAFPKYSTVARQQYIRDMENAIKYRQWKADKIQQYRENLAATQQQPTMTGAETRKADKALEQMGLSMRPPKAVRINKVDEVLKKILGE